MKKYFLLATTALLLSTSNVMAESLGSVSTTMNVYTSIEVAPTISIINEINWGTLYVDSGASGELGRFTSGGFEPGERVKAHKDTEQGVFFYGRPSNVADDLNYTLSFPERVVFNETLYMKDISTYESGGKQYITATLYSDAGVMPGQASAPMMITVNYE